MSSRAAGAEKRARTLLEKLVKELPDTEAAREAATIRSQSETK
jgi:hypothetical protein